jgi:hypothetical protein
VKQVYTRRVKISQKLLYFVVLLLPVVAVAGPADDNSADYKPVRLIAPLEKTIPPELKELGIVNPRVNFHVIVGPKGELTDFLAVSATHVGLLSSAEEKLSEARFEPATLNGVPTSGKITVIITFFDPEQRAWKQGFTGTPMGGNVSDAVIRKLYHADPDAYALHESQPAELDSPPTLIETKIYRLHAPDAAPPSGRVIVEYYIDHQGRVRLPEIIKSDDEYLSLSAIMSLQETRFADPTNNGRPTYVRVRQPFNF